MNKTNQVARELVCSGVDKQFARTLLSWYKTYGRHSLPWQKNNDWYSRLLSEIMLQQTQVQTVIPYFEKFLAAYPTANKLAKAEDDDVMKLWAGLGYYARCRNLLKAVRIVEFDRGGTPPSTAEEWVKLPGVGPSTAGALAAFVNGERAVMCDGNVQRTLSRIFAIEGYPGLKCFNKEVWAKAETLLPESVDMGDYTQALMDFGSMVCNRKPNCSSCPMRSICQAYAKGTPTAYPQKKPKRERPIKMVKVAIYVSRYLGTLSIWLKKRTKTKIWNELWCPEMTSFVAAGSPLPELQLFEDCVRATTTLPIVTHDFTHFRLIIAPILVEIGGDLCEISSGDEEDFEDDNRPFSWLEEQGFESFNSDPNCWPALPAPIKTILEAPFASDAKVA